jgi:hypothetical protein
MERLMALLEKADLNTVVIDIKDTDGKMSYIPKDEKIRVLGVGEKRIRDLPALIEKLHQKNIYVIGRLAVFKDQFFISKHPEEAFKDSGTAEVWKDFRGVSWLLPNSKVVFEYNLAVARDAYEQGFDEINVDYVRFPSDGNLKALDKSEILKSRAETMKDFFVYLDTELRQKGIPLSADLFGLVMSATDDIGIGQELTLIAPYVDYICPMVYPSHFWDGSYGYDVPAKYPYEIIHRSLSDGIKKLTIAGVFTDEISKKIRPWFQEFDLNGVPYTTEMVYEQTRAAKELGVQSWLFWDPRNEYNEL